MPPKKSHASTSSKKRAAASDGDESGAATDYSDAPAASENKKNAAKKGKKKRAPAGSDDGGGGGSDDDAPAAAPAKGKGKKGKGSGALSDEMRKKLVMEMTRHALFCEQTRKPFKRDDVTKTVLADYKRSFNELFSAVQRNLRNTLGMELVAARHKEGATGKAPTKSWTLRSTLPLKLIRGMVEQDDKLLPKEDDVPDAPGTQALLQFHEWNTEEGYARDVKKEEAGAYGLLGVILGLILTSGKVLGEDQLVAYLRKLDLELDRPIPSTFASRPLPGNKEHRVRLDKYLTLLATQGYLEKGKSGAAGGQTQATQGKSQKLQGSGAMVGDPSIEWKWGSRAENEIGEMGIARFLQTIYESKGAERDDDEEEEEEEGEGKGAAPARRAKGNTGEKLLKEIARAAGKKDLDEAMDFKAGEV